MSVSSIVSFAKRDINELLPGMQNANYFIPASVNSQPSILHVPDSFYYKPNLEGDGQDRVKVESEEIARSIVHMHVTSQLQFRPEPPQHPAIFAVPNEEVTPEIIKVRYVREAKAALDAQKRWFVALVSLADDDWNRLHNHSMISDIQRMAAESLGLERPWLFTPMDEADRAAIPGCPFCGTNLLNPNAPICPTCGKVHNPEKLAELEARMTKSNPATKVS